MLAAGSCRSDGSAACDDIQACAAMLPYSSNDAARNDGIGGRAFLPKKDHVQNGSRRVILRSHQARQWASSCGVMHSCCYHAVVVGTGQCVSGGGGCGGAAWVHTRSHMVEAGFGAVAGRCAGARARGRCRRMDKVRVYVRCNRMLYRTARAPPGAWAVQICVCNVHERYTHRRRAVRAIIHVKI